MLTFLAQTFAEQHPNWNNAWCVIYNIAAVIGLIFIIFAIALFFVGLPEMMKYLKKSSL
jgi:hypothetical protein